MAAVPLFKDVLEADDTNIQVMYYLARSYQKDTSLLEEPERTEQVKALMNRIIELEPNSEMARYARINMPK